MVIQDFRIAIPERVHVRTVMLQNPGTVLCSHLARIPRQARMYTLEFCTVLFVKYFHHERGAH